MKESTCEDTTLPQMESAAKLIIKCGWSLQLQQQINDGDRDQFNQYLYAVDEIQQCIKSSMISRYETQGTCGMKTLQRLFQGILDCSISAQKSEALSSTAFSSSLTSSYGYELQGSQTGHGELSPEQVYRLRTIVERLNSTGCLKDSIDVYIISRKSAVDARFMRFCIGNWTINDLQSSHCVEFATKIKIWIQAANRCYNNIFHKEMQYFEQILDGVRAVTYDNCFLAIVKHVAVELNNFADAVSSTASFQKLFAVLDLYKAMSVILPEIQKIFHTVSSANISDGAIKIINNLATLVRKLFRSFEDTVLNEQSNTPLPEGTIHCLTEYVMKFVTSISLHKELLTNIIVSRPIKSLGNQADDLFLDASGGTPLGLHIIWIITSLRINLEHKSRLYKDSTLRYVFIANNLDFIIKTITTYPELLEMIGKECPSKLSTYIAQAAQDHSSTIWHGVLYCLRDDGLNYNFPFNTVISRNLVKNRFKVFNVTFIETCQTQSRMFVPDIHIQRSQLQKLILSKLLPAYKSFLKKYGSHIQSKRYNESYIKYLSEDIEKRVKSC